MTFTFDETALKAACDDFGLTLPPMVRPTRIAYINAQGIYDGIDMFHPAHLIRVAVDATSPNATLWHELCHAKQCERIGDWRRYATLYNEQLREALREAPADASSVDVKNGIPFEREAIDYANRAIAGELPVLILSGPPAMLHLPIDQYRKELDEIIQSVRAR